jgi:serine O-acetyltransferase
VVFCYPGFQVLLFHRLAHWLWKRRWYFLGRFVAHAGRVLTAIDIHPGAEIGKRLFIDHGIGVVIGETAEIGDDCTIYQGVTLGGTRPTADQAGHKRHPTIGNNVIVSSGAQVLGPFKVGDGATIGASAVVLREVPEGATMVGNPARQITRRLPGEARPAFEPYGVSGEDIPDPIARALSGLLDEVASLRARVNELESEKATPERPGARIVADEAESERLS